MLGGITIPGADDSRGVTGLTVHKGADFPVKTFTIVNRDYWLYRLGRLAAKVRAKCPDERDDQHEELGVSLRDVAFAVQQDDALADRSRKEWADSGKIEASSIGKCPLDGRKTLYRLDDVLRDVGKILSLSKPEIIKYRQALTAKLRKPATE